MESKHLFEMDLNCLTFIVAIRAYRKNLDVDKFTFKNIFFFNTVRNFFKACVLTKYKVRHIMLHKL